MPSLGTWFPSPEHMALGQSLAPGSDGSIMKEQDCFIQVLNQLCDRLLLFQGKLGRGEKVFELKICTSVVGRRPITGLLTFPKELAFRDKTPLTPKQSH